MGYISVESIFDPFMLGLHQVTTNLGPIYELKNYGFLRLVSSR